MKSAVQRPWSKPRIKHLMTGPEGTVDFVPRDSREIELTVSQGPVFKWFVI